MALEAPSSIGKTHTSSRTTDSSEDCKNFYIFGQGISFSMSAVIHTAAFKHHSLPHTYQILQSETVDELAPIVNAPTFGGASVTMPHKLSIKKFCSSVSSHARIIGAINTLVVVPRKPSKGDEYELHGENTDWSGLVACMQQNGSNVVSNAKRGLVIGAGGASRAALYALHQMNISEIYLVNRTRATAEKIAADYASNFHIIVIDSLSDITVAKAPEIIIGTVPAETLSMADIPEPVFAQAKGVCIDMSYKPRETPLLKVAAKHPGWATVTGVEVLLEQAFHQSSLWLQLPVPKELMRRGGSTDQERTLRIFLVQSLLLCSLYELNPTDIRTFTCYSLNTTTMSKIDQKPTEESKKLYLAGVHVTHSIAPPMHNFIASSLSLPWQFYSQECPNVEDVLERFRRPDFAGGVVTMPYKKAIMPLLDGLDELAQRLGACNNVYLTEDGKLRGTNTDWRGIKGCLLSGLKPDESRQVAIGKPALIVGAGGASRAAVYALFAELDCGEIYIVNRDAREVADLFEDCWYHSVPLAKG
ncbi:hypothetical protein VTL71DRAFT_15545 [Oculimacula yallundae]|uniref:Uncharacterized protein n=1 Tax=Oculimacula yallundae TaxID=86028 RepID=A0ABR4CHN4_9HELO